MTDSQSTACPSSAQLEAFVRAALDTSELDLVATHVSGCEKCQRDLDSFVSLGLGRDPQLASDKDSPGWNSQVVGRIDRFVHQQVKRKNTPDESLPAIPGCQVIGLLGRGGMGTVYLAWQQHLQRHVAVKTLPADAFANDQARLRFAREIAAVGKLSHPSIVTAFDADEVDGVFYLVMEYLPGSNLAALVRSAVEQVPLADACEMIRQAAVAIQYVHEQGMFHRDIKPANLHLTSDGSIKVLDLGLVSLSRSGRDELTQTGVTVGTIDYMAPEQADGSAVDARSDVYSLGASLFKLLSGVSPLSVEAPDAPLLQKLTALATGKIRSLTQLRPDVPAKLVELVERTLQTDRNDRPVSASALAEELAPFCAGHALQSLVTQEDLAPLPSSLSDSSEAASNAPKRPLEPSSAVPPPLESHSRPWGSLTIVAALALLLIAGVALYRTRNGKPVAEAGPSVLIAPQPVAPAVSSDPASAHQPADVDQPARPEATPEPVRPSPVESPIDWLLALGGEVVVAFPDRTTTQVTRDSSRPTAPFQIKEVSFDGEHAALFAPAELLKFAELSHLESLEIAGVHVLSPQLIELKRRLPACMIRFTGSNGLTLEIQESDRIDHLFVQTYVRKGLAVRVRHKGKDIRLDRPAAFSKLPPEYRVVEVGFMHQIQARDRDTLPLLNAQLPELESVFFGRQNYLTATAVTGITKAYPELKELGIAGLTFRTETGGLRAAEVLPALENLHQLESFIFFPYPNASEANVKVDQVMWAKGLLRHEKIQHIHVRGIATNEFFEVLLQHTSLKRLAMENCRFDASTASTLLAMPHLEELCLAGEPMLTIGLVEQILRSAKLRRLEFGRPSERNIAMKHLAVSELKELAMRYSHVEMFIYSRGRLVRILDLE